MLMYRDGYEFYCEMCSRFGLEPINYHYYLMQLSQEQLVAYNDKARLMKGSLQNG